MELELKLTNLVPGEVGAGLHWGGEAFGALMTYRGIDARPGVSDYNGLKLLDAFFRAETALGFYDAATGEWGDTAGGVVVGPWRSTKPALDEDGGANGRGALVTTAASNPGVLISPINTLEFREDTDQTFVAIFDPGPTGGGSKAIVAGDQYADTPYFGVSTANRLVADFKVSVGVGLQTDANVVETGRWNVAWYYWNATTRSLGIGARLGSVLVSATMPDDDDNHIVYPRLCFFGAPERDTVEEPALTPGNPRTRLPAQNFQLAGFLSLNADLRTDPDLAAAVLTYLQEEHPSALAAYT